MKKMFQSAIMAFILLCGLQLTGCNPSEGNNPSISKTELWPAKGSNGKWGYINRKGIFVIQPNFDYASIFSCEYAVVYMNGTQMYIDTEGKFQNSPVSSEANDFCNNYAVIRENSRYGVIDKNFKYVVQPIYYELGSIVAENGLISFSYSSEEKYGFLDVKTGKVAIQPQYDYAYPFIGDYAVVSQNHKNGIINKNGEYVAQPIYESVYPLGDKLFVIADKNSSYTWYYGIMDEKGNIIVNLIYSDIPESITTIGTVLPLGNLIAVENNSGKWGFIDHKGNEKIPFQYDHARPFVEGYAVVTLNSRKMIIDESGDIVFMLDEGEYSEYDNGGVYGFINGLILTNMNGSHRYRDLEGNIVYMW